MGDTIRMEGCGLGSEGALSCISSLSPILPHDLSSCHRCGLRFPINCSIDRFHTLDSQWRIVLLCYDCLDGVRSAKVCSYCFLAFPEAEQGILGCFICSCRVHRACVPLHHRNLYSSQVETGKFICVDCCPVHGFRGHGLNKSGDSTSRPRFRFLFEDLVWEAKSISEKKVNTEGNMRKNITKKATVRMSSTEVPRKAIGNVHLLEEPTHINTISDEEFALRLHRSINGSQRISRSLCPKVKTPLTIVRKVRESNISVDFVDSNSCGHHVKIAACSENKSLLEVIESSQSILTSSLFEWENEDLLTQIRGYDTEGLEDFPMNEKTISYRSPDSTSDCSNVGSASLPSNSSNIQSNNTMSLTKFRFGIGVGFSELQRKAIDAPGSDRYAKKYFRRQRGSRRFLLGS